MVAYCIRLEPKLLAASERLRLRRPAAIRGYDVSRGLWGKTARHRSSKSGAWVYVGSAGSARVYPLNCKSQNCGSSARRRGRAR